MSNTVKNILKSMLSAFLAFILPTVLSVGAFATEAENNMRLQDVQAAIRRMRSGFENFEEQIDISQYNIPPQELARLFAIVTKNSPYLFCVDKNLTYTYRTGGNVVSVTPKYNCTQAEYEQMRVFCESEVEKIAVIADTFETELDKLIFTHDILCQNFSYDLTLESNNIYTFLTTKKGTCQGYTWTYMAVLRELGIECEYVASDSIVHIWLRVKIDGEWYYSDVTWDDPPSDEGKEMPVSRRHFLFSDSKADADGYTDRYGASDEACVSIKYDNTDFSEIFNPTHKSGDFNGDGKINAYDVICFRIYAEQKECAVPPCPICADADCDMIISNRDIQFMREMILTNSGE